MVEENPAKDSQQNTGGDSKLITPVPPVPAPIQPPKPVQSPQQTGVQSTGQPGEGHPNAAVGDVEKDLSTFERQMLWATWVAVIVAGLTGIILYSQFRIMGDQTKILSDQGISAIAGAIESERNTREQLRIANAQAQAAQDSVRAIQQQMRQDQRPWLDIEFSDIVWAENQPLGVSMTLVNKGKTPAKNLDGKAFVEKIILHERPHFGRSVSHFGTGMLVPNFTVTGWGFYSAQSPYAPVKMSASDIKELEEGHAIAVVHGIVTFDDIFGIHHWIKFCSYTPKRTFAANVDIQDTAAPCVDYKNTDTN